MDSPRVEVEVSFRSLSKASLGTLSKASFRREFLSALVPKKVLKKSYVIGLSECIKIKSVKGFKAEGMFPLFRRKS